MTNHLDSCIDLSQDLCMKTWPSLDEEWKVRILRFERFLLDGRMYLKYLYHILSLCYFEELIWAANFLSFI